MGEEGEGKEGEGKEGEGKEGEGKEGEGKEGEGKEGEGKEGEGKEGGRMEKGARMGKKEGGEGRVENSSWSQVNFQPKFQPNWCQVQGHMPSARTY